MMNSLSTNYTSPFLQKKMSEKAKGVYLNQKVQTKLTIHKEEWRDRACEHICQFFYEPSILNNTVTLPSFAHVLEAIGAFDIGLRDPTPYEMSGPFLYKSKKKV